MAVDNIDTRRFSRFPNFGSFLNPKLYHSRAAKASELFTVQINQTQQPLWTPVFVKILFVPTELISAV